jgi:hypothetical protein
MMDAHGGIGIVVRIDPSEPAQARATLLSTSKAKRRSLHIDVVWTY